MENHTILLAGIVRDQAGLFGLLNFIRETWARRCSWWNISLNDKQDKEKEMKPNILKTVFSGIAVAMGVAVIVTNILNPLSGVEATNLLGIGLAALGLSSYQK